MKAEINVMRIRMTEIKAEINQLKRQGERIGRMREIDITRNIKVEEQIVVAKANNTVLDQILGKRDKVPKRDLA